MVSIKGYTWALLNKGGVRPGSDRMVAGFRTTYAIRVYHH